VNNALSAQFALAGWCNSILHNWGQEKLAQALLADTSRQTVQLSFTGVLLFTSQDLLTLVSHLPIGLRVLRLDLGFTGLEHLDDLAHPLSQRTSVLHLELRFPGCRNLRNLRGLGLALKAMPQLRFLHLWLSKLPNLQDISGLAEALPSLAALEGLVLNVARCPLVPPEDKEELSRAVRRLRYSRRSVLESWVNISGADEDSWLPRPLKYCIEYFERCCAKCPTSSFVRNNFERSSSPAPSTNCSAAPSPVLLGRLAASAEEKTPGTALPASPRSAIAEEVRPFPCSQPGCRAFHDDVGGYCPVHRRFRIPWTIAQSVWVGLQRAWLAFLVLTLAVLELESKAMLTCILVALSPILCRSLAMELGGSPVLWFCILLPILLSSVFGTAARFNKMYRIATEFELTLEALCTQMLQSASVSRSSEDSQMMSTLLGCESCERYNVNSMEELRQANIADLRTNFLLARKHQRAFEREVCEPINAALRRDESPSQPGPAQASVMSLPAAQELLATVGEPRCLVDLLYCDVICEDFQQIRSVLRALEGRAASEEYGGHLAVVYIRDGFSQDFLSVQGRCGEIIVDIDGYLATVRVYEAALHELQVQMGEVHSIIEGSGLLGKVLDLTGDHESEELCYLQPVVEITPPMWFRILACVLRFIRMAALLTSMYFACQYFVRYGPKAVQDGLPPFLCSLLAYSNTHDDDMETLKKEISFVEDEKQRYTWSLHLHKDAFFLNLLYGLMYSLPYVVHIVIFASDILRAQSLWTLKSAPGKRTKPMHKIYERFFGIDGSLYVFKVAVLQLFTVLLQSCGKLALLGAIVTAGEYADAQEHGRSHVSLYQSIGFWVFCFFLLLNSLYPAALIVFRDYYWARFSGAALDAAVHMAYILTYLCMSIISLRYMHFEDTITGNFGTAHHLTYSNELNPVFLFPTNFLGYLSVYISLVHICCVCRALEDAAAKFIMSPDNFSETLPEPPHRRTRSSQSLSTTALTMRTWCENRSMTMGFGYALILLGCVGGLLAGEPMYPFVPYDEQCYPCYCEPGPSSGTYLLTSCELASVLRFKHLNLADRHISEIHPRVFKKFGPDLLVLSLSLNDLEQLPPKAFQGLSELRLLDLGRCKISSLTDDVFVGLEQVATLTLSQNNLQQLPPGVLQPMPRLEQLLLGGTVVKNGTQETIVLGNPLSTLPPGLFDNMDSLQLVDVSQNRLTSLPPKLFNSISKLRALELQDNLLEEIAPEVFANLPRLQNLTLAHNLLHTLSPRSFQDLPALTDLDLSNNLLGSGALPSLQGLAELRYLNISGNRFLHLPTGAFSGLLALQWLDISKISLKELMPGVFAELGSLKDLWAEGLQVKALPLGVFDGLHSLESLGLRGTAVAVLAEGVFDPLEKLRRLDLGRNMLVQLNGSLFRNLSQLRILGLSANQLDEVAPESFAGLSGLAHLSLAHNLLTNLTRDAFSHLQSLVYLDLSFNPLHDLRALLPWSLRSLILSDMNLAEIDDDCLTNATLLEVLDIGGNVLTELPSKAFSSLSALRVLDASRNRLVLANSTPFDALTALELLDLSDNELSDLHPGLFRNLQKLRALSLSDNELKVLPPGMFQGLRGLQRLDLRVAGLKELQQEAFRGLDSLGFLDLSQNFLCDLPEGSFGSLRHLELLNLSSNPLCQVTGAAFLNLSSLKVLDLANLCMDSMNRSFFAHVPDLMVFNISANRLVELPEELFVEASALTAADLSQNRIERVDVNAFQGLRSLKVLEMEGNEVAELPGEVFSHLTSLERLSLADNRFVELGTSTFQGLAALLCLDLARNSLEQLHDSVFNSLSQLVILDLSGNRLTGLQNNMSLYLPSLQSLDLSGNRLRSLARASLEGLAGLHTLRLHGNQLSTLEDDVLGSLLNLQLLDLSENQLTRVPKRQLSKLQILKELNLAGNQLRAASGVVPALINLETVDLSSNPLGSSSVFASQSSYRPLISLRNLLLRNVSLTAVPDIGKLLRLRTLDLSDNALGELQQRSFEGLKSLTVLRLRNAGLKDLSPGAFGDLVQLRQLDLSDNLIKVLPDDGFQGLLSLRDLQLAGNQLQALQAPVFDELWNLLVLNLHGNRLRDLGASLFDSLARLRVLDLSYNRLAVLPDGLLTPLISLEELDVAGNFAGLLDASSLAELQKLLCSCSLTACLCKQRLLAWQTDARFSDFGRVELKLR